LISAFDPLSFDTSYQYSTTILPPERFFILKKNNAGVYATMNGKLNTPKDKQNCPSIGKTEMTPDCLPGISYYLFASFL